MTKLHFLVLFDVIFGTFYNITATHIYYAQKHIQMLFSSKFSIFIFGTHFAIHYIKLIF